MAAMHVFSAFIRTRTGRVAVGVLAAVALVWTGFGTAPTGASEHGDRTAATQAPAPVTQAVQDSLSQAYSSWLSAAHQRATKDGQDSLLPEQF